jgi:hypothetical protein
MSDVAKYFEKMGDNDKAITLYSKAGNVQKALALCYKTSNTAMMESIICHLNPVEDELSIRHISKFLADHGSHESALKLFIAGQKYNEVDCYDFDSYLIGIESVGKREHHDYRGPL